MGNIRKMSRLLAVLLAMVLLLSVSAAAQQNGAVWCESAAAEDGICISIWADANAGSGVIQLTYHKAEMKFLRLELEEAYVQAHSINAKIPGQVKVSWIAPANAAADGSHVLMRLYFEGTSAESLAFAGSAFTPDGESLQVTMLDFAPLNGLIESAEGQDLQGYTEESVAQLQTALQEAKALLEAEHVAPAQIEAAIAKLEQALQGLQQPLPTTQPTTQPTGQISEPNNGWIGIVAAAVAVCAAVVVVVIVLTKKREKK